MKKIVTIVGSRETPPDIMLFQQNLTSKLEQDGFFIRTGDCKKGGDAAARAGVRDRRNIDIMSPFDNIPQLGYDLVWKLHPAPGKLKEHFMKLHARNAMQVLGRNCDDPSDFLICYTTDGCKTHAARTWDTGGTGQAISIADTYGLRVFNLANVSDYEILWMYLNDELDYSSLI